MTAAAAAAELAPTRARMQRDATDQAARILADARREADGIAAQARQDAERTVSLARTARLEAGPGGTVTASEDGGVVARSPGVLVDCSLPRLADLATEALGGEVRELWPP